MRDWGRGEGKPGPGRMIREVPKPSQCQPMTNKEATCRGMNLNGRGHAGESQVKCEIVITVHISTGPTVPHTGLRA